MTSTEYILLGFIIASIIWQALFLYIIPLKLDEGYFYEAEYKWYIQSINIMLVVSIIAAIVKILQ